MKNLTEVALKVIPDLARNGFHGVDFVDYHVHEPLEQSFYMMENL